MHWQVNTWSDLSFKRLMAEFSRECFDRGRVRNGIPFQPDEMTNEECHCFANGE